MKFNFLILSFVTLLSIQCTSDNRIFKANTISGNNIKMMIIPTDGNTLHNDLNADLKNGIEITDIAIIQKIYDTQPIKPLSSMFMLKSTGIITINGEIHSNFFLNKEFTNIHTSLGNFEISDSVFLNNQSSFHPINMVSINAEDKKSAVEIRNKLIEAGTFILFNGIEPIPTWVKFNGKIILGISGEISSRQDFEDQLKTDLSNSIEDFEIGELVFLDEIKSVEVSCDKISGEIPSKYTILSEFEKFKNIQITTIGTEKKELEKLISELGNPKVTME